MKKASPKLAAMVTIVPAIVVFRCFNTHFNTERYTLPTRSRKLLNQYLRPLSSIAFDKSFDESIGTRVTATTRDAINEKETVNAKGVNKSDAIPSTKTIGRKTTSVVVVDAITAGANSEARLVADSNKLYPRCL